MKTSLHSVLSATIGLGLGAYTAISAVSGGFISDATVTGINLLALYGLAEIGMLSYSPRPGLRRVAVPTVVRREEPVVVRREMAPARNVPRRRVARMRRDTAIAA